jgi:hypothetical protein
MFFSYDPLHDDYDLKPQKHFGTLSKRGCLMAYT